MSDYAHKIMESPDAPRQIEALYNAMNDEKRRRQNFRKWLTPHTKAEFINGQIIEHSSSEFRHIKTLNFLYTCLSIYSSKYKIGSIGISKVMISLTRNDYEPDLVFFSKEKADTFTEDQMLFPAPDFVVEILSKKTAAKDKGIKKQDYAAHGIQEYWIIDPVRQQIEQYILFLPHDKQYSPPKIFTLDDEIESRVIKGFNIPVQALFDDAINLETLQNLLK